jgi:serine protease Do
MNWHYIFLIALAGCFSANLARGQDPPTSREVLLIEEAMKRAIGEVEPSIATVLVSRSEVYRKRFHDQPPEDEPGKLGPFNPDAISQPAIGSPTRPEKAAKSGGDARKYDLAAPDYVPEAFGSGVVIDGNELLVLTTYHVVRDATKIYVRFSPDRGSYVDIHAADPRSDLAVLHLLNKSLAPLKPIKFGDGGAVQKGQLVVAISNPFAAGFRDGSPGASWGIISNIRRPASPGLIEEDRLGALYLLRTLLQTDARLNRGCSGGALIDLKGQMIGLTTARAAVPGSETTGELRRDSSGFTTPRSMAGDGETAGGLAVPIDANWKRIIDRLRQGAEVEYGFLGVQWSRSARPDGEGEPRINQVIGGSPAEKGGLRPGDWIQSVNGVPVQKANDLLLAISMTPAGTEARIEVRDRARISVTLAKYYVRGKIIASRKMPAVRGIRVDFTSVLYMQQDQAFQFPFQRREIQPGVFVSEVQPGSRAANAKLQVNDVITHVNGRNVDNPAEFYRQAAKVPGAEPLELTLYSSDWTHGSRSTSLLIP